MRFENSTGLIRIKIIRKSDFRKSSEFGYNFETKGALVWFLIRLKFNENRPRNKGDIEQTGNQTVQTDIES